LPKIKKAYDEGCDLWDKEGKIMSDEVYRRERAIYGDEDFTLFKFHEKVELMKMKTLQKALFIAHVGMTSQLEYCARFHSKSEKEYDRCSELAYKRADDEKSKEIRDVFLKDILLAKDNFWEEKDKLLI